MKNWFFLIILFGGVLWIFHRTPSPLGEPQQIVESPQNKIVKSGKNQPLAQAPRARLIAPEKVASLISESCRSFWESLRNVDLVHVMEYPPRVQELPNGSACERQPLPDWLQTYHTRFAASCKTFDPGKSAGMTAEQWRKTNKECHLNTLVYRAAITHWLTEGEEIFKISDPALLTDKMVIELQQGNLEKVAALAERLLEIDLKSYTAAEAKMVAYTMMAMRDGRNRPNDPMWEKASQSIEAVRGLRGESNEAITASLLVEFMQNRDINRLETLSQRAQLANPSSPVPAKFMALTQFQRGDSARALELLQRAGDMGDFEALEIAERIRSGQKSPFQLGLSSSFVAFEAN